MGSITKLRCCDYAHFYMGCRYRYTWPDGDYIEGILDAILYGGMLCGSDIGPNVKADDKENWYEIADFRNEAEGKFQLFLTHPSDMTGPQIMEYKELCKQLRGFDGKFIKTYNIPFAAIPIFIFLLKNEIDVFNLIDFGDAINKINDLTYLKSEIDRTVCFQEWYKIPNIIINKVS